MNPWCHWAEQVEDNECLWLISSGQVIWSTWLFIDSSMTGALWWALTCNAKFFTLVVLSHMSIHKLLPQTSWSWFSNLSLSKALIDHYGLVWQVAMCIRASTARAWVYECVSHSRELCTWQLLLSVVLWWWRKNNEKSSFSDLGILLYLNSDIPRIRNTSNYNEAKPNFYLTNIQATWHMVQVHL